MAEYTVEVPFIVWVTVGGVEADSEAEAVNEGIQQAYLTGFVGNGGSGKLIGVSDTNLRVEASDQFYEDDNIEPRIVR